MGWWPIGEFAGLLLALSAAAPGAPPAGEFNLMCLGAETQAGAAPASPAASDRSVQAGRRATIDLSLDARGGRIHIPFDLFGKGRGVGEWYELQAVRIAPHHITAVIDSRLFGRPKLWVSRLDGSMSISVKDRQFLGLCSRFDEAQSTRSF